MTDFYSINSKFYLAVDCIIFGFSEGELKVLLIKRNLEPAFGDWSLVGGFLKQDETLDQAAKRILFNLTGLDHVFMEQLHSFSQIDRDPGERVISVAYYALMKTSDYDKKLVTKHNAHWIKLEEIPKLIFDHNEILETALMKLRRKSGTQPIGFELLPKEFTLPQLQELYEAIFQKKFDKRNFRKKILTAGFLKNLEIKDKSNSRKGAYLYKFDSKKYNALVKKGYNFSV